MKSILEYLKPLSGLIFFGFMAWYFSDILTYFIIAAVLSMLGRPMVKFFMLPHFRKFRLNKPIASLLSLISMILILIIVVLFIVPLVKFQSQIIAQIDMAEVMAYFNKPINDLYAFMASNHIIEPDMSLGAYIEDQLNKLLEFVLATNLFTSILSTTGSILLGIFVVMFLTFFFLKDEYLLKEIILVITPDKYTEDMKVVLSDSRVLLTRYFLGILLELVSMMTLITLGLSLFGVENAIIIGVMGGLMNIIPYLGPIIGAGIGIVLGVISVLSLGLYDQVLTTILIIIATFAAANAIDNVLLQPLIYSKSVKAHPIEIFLVIIMAGKIGGIVGMIIAIPTYTVIRVVARQFLSQLKFVKALTESLNVPSRSTAPVDPSIDEIKPSKGPQE
jgi:predicted PurR-regulated permease PerM